MEEETSPILPIAIFHFQHTINTITSITVGKSENPAELHKV